jgi:DAK2 domain fusion protein YloV
MSDPSIERFYRVVAVAHAHLEERRQEINDANVFPVADGDTGDNMAGTIKAVLDALENLRTSSLAGVDRNLIVTTVAHAALMGARGNSGVILSQIVRGAAEVLTTRRGELIGPALVRDALGDASVAAWASVGDPQEGTMLTVIREMHEAVAAAVAEMELTELPDDVTEAAQDAMFAELMGVAITSGLAALERTPEQLDVLAEAEVVDAGAYGLMVILGGIVTGLAGGDGPSPMPHQSAARLHAGAHFDSRYQFCTSCIVTGRDLAARSIVPRLEELGDSVAVVGDETMLKVHVHADDRDRVRLICEEYGDVDQFEATDMHVQVAARTAEAGAIAHASPLERARTGVVAVASGSGLTQLFGSEGALVIDGGATLNPSIEELLAGIREAPGEEVILLPNSPNVLMAAREAARLAERPAHVVSSVAQQAGLAALVGAYDADDAASDNASRMEAELEAISTGLVAEADRDDADGRYRRGEAVGFVGDELVAWGDPRETLGSVLERLSGDAEIVTVIEGEEAPAAAAELDLAARLNGAELEVMDGGQPTYWWLVAAQ